MVQPAPPHRVAIAGILALGVANGRYWSTVHPCVRRQLARWERHAARIRDRTLRQQARTKLNAERFNAEVAATLATLVPRVRRLSVVEAIVALQVLYDYLDGLGEQPSADPLRTGLQLFSAFSIALTGRGDPRDCYRYHAHADDGGFLAALARTCHAAFASLPTASAVVSVALEAAARCRQAQSRTHARDQLGAAQLRRWAEVDREDGALAWWEHAAGGAASILAVHAIIAAAAIPGHGREQARAIDRAYVAGCALSTLLDSLIDREQDLAEGDHSFVGYYADETAMAEGIARVARRAAEAARALPDGAHHHMTVAGIAAYYLSSPAARTARTRPVADAVIAELRPVITPILAIFRAWRWAKRCRERIARVRRVGRRGAGGGG